MSEDGKSRGFAAAADHHPHYYGTFQGVANYYPSPAPSQPPSLPAVGFPHPVPPQGTYGGPQHHHHGYHAVQGYAVVEGRPIRESRLPCCGIGMGWLLFIIGFFLGGVPWYVGTFLLLFVQVDYREKPGLLACTVASVLAVLAITLGATKRAHAW